MLTNSCYIVAERPRAVRLDVLDRVLRAGADGEAVGCVFGEVLVEDVALVAALPLAFDDLDLAESGGGTALAPSLASLLRCLVPVVLAGGGSYRIRRPSARCGAR